ncbi:hypothetical protein HUU05_17600 [candidate division KSB1 bacterium]|nr:hypothetical protein [candidate division KSB1 bacterium]
MKRILPLQLVLLFVGSLLFLASQEKPLRGAHTYSARDDERPFASSASDSIFFQDDFEQPDTNWRMFEELHSPCHGEKLGSIQRVTEFAGSGAFSLRVWANKQNSDSSNHVNAHYRVYPQSVTGRYVYCIEAYIPTDVENGHTGPEFSVQNTRATSALDSTFTAGLQYIGNPQDGMGTRWNIWHEADWVPFLKDSLAKGQWY